MNSACPAVERGLVSYLVRGALVTLLTGVSGLEREGGVGRVEEAVVRTTVTRAEMNLPLLTDEEREFLLKRSAIC